jgi:hypothetical protein
MNRYSLALIFLFVPLLLCAQEENCEQKLTRAANEFELGHFTGIQALLKPCIDNFTAEQKKYAYLLLVQAYLLLDDPIGAEEGYLKLLATDPEFVPDASLHPIELVYLSKKYTAAPIFSLFAKTGTNISTVAVIQDIDAHGYAALGENYSIRPGFQAGVGVDWHALERFTVSSELNYQLTVFSKTEKSVFGKDELQVTERQTWLNVPLYIKYTHPLTKQYSVYGYTGYSMSLLVNDRASFAAFNKDAAPDDDNEIINKETELESVNMKPVRNTLNFGVIMGAGVRLKYKLNYLFADVRFAWGLKNVVKENNVFQNDEVGYQIPYVDDLFRLNHASINIGYVWPLYKPRELKRVRNKSVLRKLRKDKNSEE